jgi:hypothetical protein
MLPTAGFGSFVGPLFFVFLLDNLVDAALRALFADDSAFDD